jgi:hypothetical protein
MRVRTVVFLAVAFACSSVPVRAQVRSLTIGVHSTCPYGLAG